MTYANDVNPPVKPSPVSGRGASDPDGPTSGVRPSRLRPAALAAELRVALMRSVRRIRAEKSDRDLSGGQFSVLAVLDRHGPLTPRELADHEGVQPPSMTRTVATLVELGLARRSDDPRDGRQVLVHLTEAGSATVGQTRRRRDAWLARRLAELSAEDRAVLARATDILGRIADS